jgi:hypothetical protein
LWQPNVRGRRVQVESEEIRIEIKPRSPKFTGDSWQPARKLELAQQISAADELTVGEPVTRTVIVNALGLEENMITEPVWPEIANVRIYPDQPQGISRDDGLWVMGTKEFRYAVVPEQEGELVLPELKVEWWDTVNDRQQVAVLPAKVLKVLPSATAPSAPSLSQTSNAATLSGVTAGTFSTGAAGYWRWLTALFAFLWVATLVVAWQFRGRFVAADQRQLQDRVLAEKEAELLGHLKKACDSNNRGLARRLLTDWITRFGSASGTGSVLEFASGVQDQALRDRIHELDSAGYRKNDDTAWNSKLFWQHFNAWYKTWKNSPTGQAASVTDLYAKENRV